MATCYCHRRALWALAGGSRKSCWDVAGDDVEEVLGVSFERPGGFRRPVYCGVRQLGGCPVFPPALSPTVGDLENISGSLSLFLLPWVLGAEQPRGMKAQARIWEDASLI